MKIPYFGSMPKCVFVLPSNEFVEFMAGQRRSVEYSFSKQPSVGDSVMIRPYDYIQEFADNPFIDGRITAIDPLPRKRGTMSRWLYTIQVQLIMF